MKRQKTIRVGILLLATLVAQPAAVGQRVQIPQSAQYVQGPTTYGGAAPAYGGAPTYGGGTTYGPAPGPPPTFDPYAAGNLGTPPSTVPYNYSPTPQPALPANPWQPYGGAPAAPNYQQPGAIYPQGVQPPIGWQPGGYSYQGDQSYLVQAQRVLQEIGVEHSWLYGDHTDPNDLEINRSEIYATFALPAPYFPDSPLLVTPGFAVNFLAGPIAPGADLPPRIYDTYLDVAWYPQVNEWFGAELGVRTGVWTDFDHVDSDAVRFLGRGLAKVSFTPQLDVLFGVVYLDRLRIKLLPAGGVYWRPTPEWDLYIVFPNPKARKHFTSVGNTQWYYYFAGEYGGGSWSVQRVATTDRIDINDIRVSVGLEWETQTFIRGHVEVGYVWDREVLYNSGAPGTFKPDDTFMVRGGLDY